jgi:surface antigen
MKVWIASASALLLATACGASKEATEALTAMKLQEGASSPLIKYAEKSGSGNTFTLKNVTVGDPETGTPGFKASSMVLGGLDMSDAGKPVVTTITFKDLTPAEPLGEGLSLNFSTVGIEGLNPIAGEFFAASLAGDQAATPPPFEQWGFKKISVNGMTLAMDGVAMGAPGSKLNVQLGEFSVSDLKETIFGNMHLDGLKGDFEFPGEMIMPGATPIKGAFDLGTADVTNIRGKLYADMFGVSMGAAMDPSAQANMGDKIMAAYTSPLEPGYDSLSWSGMTAEAAGAKLEASKLSSVATRNAEGVVTALKSPRATLTFTADSAGGMFGQFATMGLTMAKFPSPKVELYSESDFTFDPATDTTRAVNYTFGVTDALDMKVAAGLQGVTKALAGLINAMGPAMGGAVDPLAGLEDPSSQLTDPTAVPAPDLDFVSLLKLVDLDVTITDKAVVGMLTALTGQTEEAARADLANQILASTQDLVTGAKAEPALANEFTAALAAFVKQPGSLNIKMKPAAPVVLDGAAPLTKQSLGFSASFTPSPAASAPN